MSNDSAVIVQLITSELNLYFQNGWTPLISAAYFCQPSVVRVLLSHSCCISLTNKDSRTALHETCRSQSDAEEDLRDIAKMLIDAGAELDSKALDTADVSMSLCYCRCICVSLLLPMYVCFFVTADVSLCYCRCICVSLLLPMYLFATADVSVSLCYCRCISLLLPMYLCLFVTADVSLCYCRLSVWVPGLRINPLRLLAGCRKSD